LGLLDTLLNKEKKLLERSRKELARADSLEKSGRAKDALAELEKTSALLKENMLFIGKMRLDFSQVFTQLGDGYLDHERAQMAQDAAKVALQLDPKNPLAMGVEGRSALKLGMAEQALTSLRNAVALAPDSENLWSALGEAQDAMGDFVGSIESYKRALVVNPLGIRHFDKILAHTPNDLDMIKKKGPT